jgi:hypothetical protein
MSIKQRDKNIEELLEIIPPQDNTEVEEIPEEKTEIIESNREQSLKRELSKNKKELEEIFVTTKEVLESAAENAISFGKSRDTEALAKLVDSMVKLQQELKDVNLKMNPEEAAKPNTINNNAVFVGNFRELLNSIKEQNSGGDK